MANGVTKANTQSVNQRKRDEAEEARRQAEARKRYEEEMKRQQEEMRRQQEEAARQQEAERKRQAETSRKNSERRNQTSSKATPDVSIPVLEERYASPEAIQRGKDFGRKALADVEAGRVQSSDPFADNPYGRGFAGMAEVYKAQAAQKEQIRAYEDRLRAENASRNEQRHNQHIAQANTVPMEQAMTNEIPTVTAGTLYREDGLTEKARNDIASIDKKIEKLNSFVTSGDAGADEIINAFNASRIRKLEQQKQKILEEGRSDRDYLVAREDYNDMMQDPEFAQDMANLEKITRDSQMMGVSMDPNGLSKALTGMKVKDYYAYLEEKYGLSEDELDDIALTKHADIRNENSDQIADTLQNFAEEHPGAGTVSSFGTKFADSAEGYANNLAGLITNDDRYTSSTFNKASNSLREGSKENIKSDGGKIAYDILTGVGDMGVGALAGSAPLVLAGSTANNAMLGALDRDQSARKAALYGTGAGAIDYVTNKIGLDKAKELGMSAIKSSGLVGFLKKMGVAGLVEGGENIIQDLSQTILDQIINNDKSELRVSFDNKVANGASPEDALKETTLEKVQDIAMSFGSGFAMGSAMMGGSAVKNAGKAKAGDLKAKFDNWRANRIPKVDDADAELNPVELAKQNEIDVNEKIDNVNQAVDNIERINNLMPKGFTGSEAEAKITPTDKVDDGRLSEIATQSTDDLSIAHNQVDRGMDGIGQFVTLHEENPLKRLDRNGVITAILEKNPNIKRESNAPRKSADTIAQEENALLEQMERYAREGFERSSDMFDLGVTPDILKEFGLKGDRIRMGTTVYDKTSLPSGYRQWDDNFIAKHGLGSEGILKLIRALDDPVIIYTPEDGNDLDLDVVVSLVDSSGDPVLVPIRIGRDGVIRETGLSGGKSNNIKSAHVRPRLQNVLKRIPENVLYIKNDGETLSEGLTPSKNLGTAELESPSDDSTVMQSGDSVNPNNDIPAVEEAMDLAAKQADEVPTVEATNEPPIPPKNEIPTPQEPKNPLGYDPNDPYVVDPNAMNSQRIEANGTRQSKLGTNTMRTLDGDEQNANDLSRGLYQYVPKTEQGTMRVGAQRVSESPTKAYNDIISTSDDAFTAEDVDTSMMLRNKIKSDLAAAKEAGDETTVNYLQSQLDALTIRQRKAASNAGQVSQAWSKWTRDADGAVFAAYNIASRQYENALKDNPKLGETMKSIAESIGDDIHRIKSEELWEELANADLSGEKVDKLSNHIQDMIKSVLEKQGNYRIKKNFQDANIKKVADTLAMQLRQGEDIGETLEMIERAGVTGFTDLDSSVEQEVKDLFDQAEMFDYGSKQRVELENQAYARLAKALNLKGDIYDIIDSIRYFAMLANPKTHIRNTSGNVSFGEITNFKDQLAGILEEAVDRASLRKGGNGIDRTTTVLWKNGADRNLYNATLDDFEQHAFSDLVGGKYSSAAQGIEGNKNVFGYGKIGSKASEVARANAKILEAEDIAAKRRKYADSLSRYLKANGYDESILKGDITDKKTLDFLDEARAHAIDQAQKATFNQENEFGDSLSRFSREARNINWSDRKAGAVGKKLAGIFLDATVPFKRTPANIVTSLWDYQPIHLARFGTDIADIVKHKPKAVNNLIDDLAKETTGIGLLAAGYGLAKAGFITGRENDETGELDELTGKQDYSLNLGPLGTYTIDWLSPSDTILLAGANLFQSGLTSEGLSQMLADIGEPVLETTMLSSLVDVLRSAQYASDPMDTVKQATATAAKNYFSQFVPTELGNIARTIDNTRRSTYTDKTGVAGIFDRTLKSVENRLPGVSKLNQPYIDRWGHEQQNLKGTAGENVFARLGYQHLSPGYYSPDDVTPKDQYLYDLYDAFPDEKVMPPAFSTSISENGVKRKVTPEEKTIKDKAEGQAREDIITAISESDEIKSLSPEQQAQVIADTYEVAKLVGNASIIDGFSSTDKGYNVYAGENGGADAFLKYELAKLKLDEANVSTSSNAGKAIQGLYGDGNVEAADKLTQDITQLSNAGVSTAGQGTYSDRGITYLGDFSAEEYADLWNKINTNNTADHPNDKIAQDELLAFFNANPKQVPDQKEAMKYWLGMLTDYNDSKKVPYYDADAKTWKAHERTDSEIELINSLSGEEPQSEQTTATQSIPQPTAGQQPSDAQQILLQSAPQRPTTTTANEIPIVTGDYTPGDTQAALDMISNSGIKVKAPEAYWNQAYKANSDITPQEFVDLWYAIDSSLGEANGGLSKPEWVQYLNNNDADYDRDMEIINMLYNTRNKKLKYVDGVWRQ